MFSTNDSSSVKKGNVHTFQNNYKHYLLFKSSKLLKWNFWLNHSFELGHLFASGCSQQLFLWTLPSLCPPPPPPSVERASWRITNISCFALVGWLPAIFLIIIYCSGGGYLACFCGWKCLRQSLHRYPPPPTHPSLLNCKRFLWTLSPNSQSNTHAISRPRPTLELFQRQHWRNFWDGMAFLFPVLTNTV